MVRSLPWILLLSACSARRDEPCECDGHGVRQCEGDDCGACMCLPFAPVEPDPTFAAEFTASPGDVPDWSTLDEALATGDVIVRFGPGVYDERLEVLRADDGPYRLVLDGGGGADRATVPGITTTQEPVKRSRVTVRGFDVADSSAQGVYWAAGDGVVIEDLAVHDTGSSPAILFEYANRTGLPSTGIVVRNNHIYDVRGECLYIGGVEDEGGTSHADLLVQNNLIHGCGRGARGISPQWDGINVKDGLTGVRIEGNVVFDTHWGISVDSPSTIAGNLVFDVASNGLHLSDEWGDGQDGTTITDTAVLDVGEHGIRIGADFADAVGISLERVLVVRPGKDGIRFAGAAGMTGTATEVWVLGADPSTNEWGDVDVTFSSCVVSETSERTAACEISTEAPDLSDRAGPDGIFFTDDDPWRIGPL